MNMDLAYKSRWQRKKYINEMAVDKDDARKCFETLFFAEERVGRTVEDFTLEDFDDWRDTLPQEKKALYTSIVSGFLAWSRISPDTKEYPQKLFEERLLCTGDDCIASPQALLKRLDFSFGPTRAGERSMCFRCYFWLLWIGVNSNETMDVEDRDVDLDEMEIRHKDKLYSIPIEAFTDFATIMSTDWYYDRNRQKRPKVAGHKLLRWYMPYTLNALTVRIANVQVEVAGPSMTTRAVSRSGLFYRTFQRELDGIPADFSAMVAEDSDSPDEQAPKRREAIRVCEADYVVWKYRCVLPLVDDIPRPRSLGQGKA